MSVGYLSVLNAFAGRQATAIAESPNWSQRWRSCDDSRQKGAGKLQAPLRLTAVQSTQKYTVPVTSGARAASSVACSRLDPGQLRHADQPAALQTRSLTRRWRAGQIFTSSQLVYELHRISHCGEL